MLDNRVELSRFNVSVGFADQYNKVKALSSLSQFLELCTRPDYLSMVLPFSAEPLHKRERFSVGRDPVKGGVAEHP